MHKKLKRAASRRHSRHSAPHPFNARTLAELDAIMPLGPRDVPLSDAQARRLWPCAGSRPAERGA